MVNYSKRLSNWGFVTNWAGILSHGLPPGMRVGNYPNMTEKERRVAPVHSVFIAWSLNLNLWSAFSSSLVLALTLALSGWRKLVKERLGALRDGR